MMISLDLVLPFVIVWAIPGIVGGIISAVMIRWVEPRVNARGLVTIAFGWLAGMIIGAIACAIVLSLAFSSDSVSSFGEIVVWIMGWSIAALLTALIGSWTTYKILEPLIVSA